LTWKNVFVGSNLTFGTQLTPGFAISEANWGYRFLEKTIMDQKGLVGAVDLGISLRGKLTSDGTFNYWLMIGNNSASGTVPENNKYKRYYADIQYITRTRGMRRHMLTIPMLQISQRKQGLSATAR